MKLNANWLWSMTNGLFCLAILADICRMEKGSQPNYWAYFSLFMGSFIVAGAIGIGFGLVDHNDFIRENRLLVAIPILLYGLLRLYRAFRLLKGKRDILN